MTPAELLAWMEFSPWIGLALLGLAALAWFFKKVLPIVRRVTHFLDDVLGEPARPGFEARPGLMERMAIQEADIREVKHEVTYNHGSSLKDAMRRVESSVASVDARLTEHLAASNTTPIMQQIVTEKEVIIRGDS